MSKDPTNKAKIPHRCRVGRYQYHRNFTSFCETYNRDLQADEIRAILIQPRRNSFVVHDPKTKHIEDISSEIEEFYKVVDAMAGEESNKDGMDEKPPSLTWAHRRKSLEPIQTMLPIMKKDRSMPDVAQAPNRIKLDPLNSPRNISPEVPFSPPHLLRTLHDLSPMSPRLEASVKPVLPGISPREGLCVVPPSDVDQPRRGSISDIHTKFDTTHLAALSASPKTPINRLTPLPSPRMPHDMHSPSQHTDANCFVFPPLEGDEEEELQRLWRK